MHGRWLTMRLRQLTQIRTSGEACILLFHTLVWRGRGCSAMLGKEPVFISFQKGSLKNKTPPRACGCRVTSPAGEVSEQ